MAPRLLLPLGLLCLALLGAGGMMAWRAGVGATAPAAPALPLPPEMPRLAEGPDYQRCLDLLEQDPAEALRFAAAWDATGGGEAATHCAALATIGLGDAARGADRLERLALASRAGNLARASVFGQAAQGWMMAGDLHRAFGAVTLALTLAPADPDLLVDRAAILSRLRRFGEALEDLDRALTLDPDRAEAIVFRAAALRQMGRMAEAAAAVERALAVAADHEEALLERGIQRHLAGDVAGARADWRRAISVSPGSGAAELAEQYLQLSESGMPRR